MTRRRTDPLTVPCPLCGAAVEQLCIRRDAHYARGSTLRVAHSDRYRAARAARRV